MNEVEVVFKVLQEHQCKKGLMIDVGAHHGGSLRSFASRGWTIHAFEPDDENRKCLEDRFGSVSNVVVDNRAVSDVKREQVPFYRSNVSSGISGLSDFHSSHERTGTVDTVTLTEYIQKQKITRVDFLKVDTEGCDLKVLKSIPWASVQPNVVICEFENEKSENYGYKFKDLANYLVGQEYQVLVSEWYPIVEYGQSHRWRTYHTYPCDLSNPEAWGNIIAVQNEDIFNSIKQSIRKVAFRQWFKQAVPMGLIGRVWDFFFFR